MKKAVFRAIRFFMETRPAGIWSPGARVRGYLGWQDGTGDWLLANDAS